MSVMRKVGIYQRHNQKPKIEEGRAIAKAQTMIFKTLHRQLYMEKHELQEVNSGAHKKPIHDLSCDFTTGAA